MTHALTVGALAEAEYVIATAGTDQARAAVREPLASGAWLSDRDRAALEATL